MTGLIGKTKLKMGRKVNREWRFYLEADTSIATRSDQISDIELCKNIRNCENDTCDSPQLSIR